jgi:hypothetical protein
LVVLEERRRGHTLGYEAVRRADVAGDLVCLTVMAAGGVRSILAVPAAFDHEVAGSDGREIGDEVESRPAVAGCAHRRVDRLVHAGCVPA